MTTLPIGSWYLDWREFIWKPIESSQKSPTVICIENIKEYASSCMFEIQCHNLSMWYSSGVSLIINQITWDKQPCLY